ncbi:hypothetical protein CAXC1_320030 [Candidatus Xenohaliotis californiensis]|uniref:Secreted protein n=1 Tax=Candidatus Xenohaliotis californiensis TaxID=84677 RepID=A0ABM9N8H8_9RICK|nr:hypothetical protein CAXC1_320030 [Candidatus Xenohaliotis californiensis]
MIGFLLCLLITSTAFFLTYSALYSAILHMIKKSFDKSLSQECDCVLASFSSVREELFIASNNACIITARQSDR